MPGGVHRPPAFLTKLTGAKHGSSEEQDPYPPEGL